MTKFHALKGFANRLLSIAGAALIFSATPAFPTWANPSEDLSQLKQDITRLGNLAERTRKKFERVLEEEKKILQSQANEKASLWRETGLHDGDLQSFSDFRQKFYFIHQYSKQNFTKVHGQFRIMKRQVAAMEIVLVGKRDKLEIIESTRSGNKFHHKVLYEFGFYKNRRNISEQMNVAEQRKDLMDALVAVYLEALAADNPQQGQEIMKSYHQVLQVLGDANRDIILDEVEKLRIQQEKMMFDMIPIFGDAMAAAEAYQGTNIWGEKLGWVDYGLAMISVLSVASDSVGVVRLFKNHPAEFAQMSKTFKSAREAAKELTKTELVLLAAMYPPQQIEKLFGASVASLMARAGKFTGNDLGGTNKLLGLAETVPLPTIRLRPGQTIKDIVDVRNPKGMALARESIAEEQRANKLISDLGQEEKALAMARAEEALEEVAPAIDINKLTNPDTMTEADWRSFQNSLDIDDSVMVGLRQDPGALTDFIEIETGIPMDVLEVKVNAITSNEYVAYRKANHESLRLLKKPVDDDFAGIVTKHKDIKGKSGPGGIIPVNQEFSKMSKELDAAEAIGDRSEIAKIRAKIRKSNRGVDDIIERGIAHKSNMLEGREVLAVRRQIDGKIQRSLVTRDPKTGILYDLQNARPLGDSDNVTILKTRTGKDRRVEILVDNKGKVFVADADPHIIGTTGRGDLVDDTKVNGFTTRSEEIMRHNQNIALRESGNISYTQHGAQVRAYGLDLPVDETFYIIENGKLRFLKQKNLQDLVHHHRLQGRSAPIDPTWEWGNYSPGQGFARANQ